MPGRGAGSAEQTPASSSCAKDSAAMTFEQEPTLQATVSLKEELLANINEKMEDGTANIKSQVNQV